jgi:hypothetical protein
MAPEVIASIVAAVTALLAVIVGPFLTMRASKNQMLGPMRQAWINSLRDTVSEFISSVYVGHLETGVLSHDEQVREAATAARHAHFQKTVQLKEKIALLSNYKESEHQELVRLVNSAFAAYETGRDTAVALKALREWSQQVLKTEWDVVKK